MKSRTLTCITAITLFVALVVPFRLAAQHTNNSEANDISANLVVTGISQNGAINPLTPFPEFDAIVWKDGQIIINLGTFGGSWNYANAINNRGQVAGFALNTPPDPMTTAALTP